MEPKDENFWNNFLRRVELDPMHSMKSSFFSGFDNLVVLELSDFVSDQPKTDRPKEKRDANLRQTG